MRSPTLPSDLPHLSSIVPSALGALRVDGFANTLGLREDISAACVLLIDGLGAELLDACAADAPVLTQLRAGTLHVGFPSTTAAGLAAVGTGLCSGEHGMVGYSFDLPGTGVVNALRWRMHPWGEDLRDTLVPEEVQPLETTFERAESAGVPVHVVSDAIFTGSGMTRAVLRGGRYVGVHALGDLAAGVLDALSAGGISYGYHSQLDLIGHLYGPATPAWRMQLRQVDRLVESIVDALPPGALLAVVADHGMVEVDLDASVDVDATPELSAGVRSIGGEARARHVYAEDGAQDDVLAAWREVLGERAWVVPKEEAIELGWFGSGVSDAVLPRLGEVVAAAQGRSAVLRRVAEPLESSLRGQHGSLTTAEQLVPLALAYG